MARRRSTRERVLTLLARERKVYNRKTREYEREPVTMAFTARELGVSVRTLRRWKNEDVQPSDKRKAKKLVETARKVERNFQESAKRDRKHHPSAVKFDIAELPTLPPGHRRQLKRYAKDKRGRVRPTGKEYESSWINYNVRGWRFRELAALVTKIWKAKHPFQFIYEVPAGGQLPKSGDKPARRVRKTTKSATAPINPRAFSTQEELLAFLNNYVDYEQAKLSRRMLYVAVDDHSAPQTDDDESDDDGEF